MRQRGNNAWQLIVPQGKFASGLTRYKSKTVHGTKREAQTALADFVAETAKGGNADAGPVSTETVTPAGTSMGLFPIRLIVFRSAKDWRPFAVLFGSCSRQSLFSLSYDFLEEKITR